MEFGVILGIGTLLILAFQGWILWRQTKIINSQREITERQTTYLTRKEDPWIEVSKKEYSDDKIILHMFNRGKTKAVGVALKTEVYIINPEVKKEGDQILMSSRGDWDIKKQANFTDGEKTYLLQPTFIEIFHDANNYPELELNQGRKFVQDVYFGLYDKKEKYPMPSKNVTFKHLLTLLKANKVLGCEIRISLVYKNLINKIVEEISLDKFYIMPIKTKSKFLSELDDKDKLTGGMKYVPIHPFLKQEYLQPKSEETYREINHCER